MADNSDFQAKQFAFAAHIRDPQHVAAPDGIEDRRMAIYREYCPDVALTDLHECGSLVSQGLS